MSSNGLIHDGLAYWARRRPDHPAAVMDGGARLTYGELARWADGIAQELQRRGIGKGDVVALAAANSLAWIPAAFAVLRAGAIITPFNDRLLGAELAWQAGHSEARLVIADAPRAALLADAGVALPVLSLESLAAFRAGPEEDFREVRASAEDPAMIIFTSGSTARPKGAMMGHGNYLAKFHEMRMLGPELGPDTRSLMPFGLHSSPGLPWGILFTTLLGGTLHFTARYNAEAALRTLVEERITFFIGAPSVYDQVRRLPGFARADLSALAFARVGGASPSAEVLEAWREAGVVVRQLYGMTEVGGGSIIASVEEALACPDSCGRGLAFSRFRIARDDGSDCAPGEPGNVLLQGPGLMLGYWRDPEASAAALAGGWMHTGDIGTVDEQGYFRFVDRAKEMIKSSGFNVSPAEIEGVLAVHPAVREVAAFATIDGDGREWPCACVFGTASADELVAHAAARLAGFKVPRYLAVLGEPLPRLANEKVDRRSLKARYGRTEAFAAPALAGAGAKRD